MFKRLSFITLFSVILVFFSDPDCDGGTFITSDPGAVTVVERNSPDKLKMLAERIGLRMKDTTMLKYLADSLLTRIQLNNADSGLTSDLYYLVGVCNLILNNYNQSLINFQKSIDLKKTLGICDIRYKKAVFNCGLSSFSLGDLFQAISYMTDYIDIATKNDDNYIDNIVDAYTLLIGASWELHDLGSFEDYSLRILSIVKTREDSIEPLKLSKLYSSIGTGYVQSEDFAKARVYLEKSENIAIKNGLDSDIFYINLLNSMAIAYRNLSLYEKEKMYYLRGIDLAVGKSSDYAFNLISNYAYLLAKSGDKAQGEMFLSDITEKARSDGSDSRFYIEVLNNYTTYLVDYTDKTGKAFDNYTVLMNYLETNKQDILMRFQVMSGYASLLFKQGQNMEALKVISGLLSGKVSSDDNNNIFRNPEIDSLAAGKSILRLLQLKYDILWDLYKEKDTPELLEAIAGTSETIVAMVEKIRMNLTEDESRIVLGDNFRSSYMNAIRDFEVCFRKTGEQRYLEKAFTYAEKSKVAGLLAATRQLKASQFHIPPGLAAKEKALQQKIGFYNSRISSENVKDDPDRTILALLNERLLDAVSARDSLVMTLEKDYPEYFSLKYSNKVPSINEIPSIIGKNCNYLNYVVSDTLLYIFVINNRLQKLLTFHTDSSFLTKLNDFKILLSDPSPSKEARRKFNDFVRTGNELYGVLIDPVRKYFRSDNLIISPDNILSYLPFEAFLTSGYNGEDILYRKLSYLMNDFNISYVYSATFMNESARRPAKNDNSLVAFAPSYAESINVDSLLMERQSGNRLYDLPYARMEAEYVAGLTQGKLFLMGNAKEDKFKSEAGKYGIIHLAMHTVINDLNPMNSAMVFSQPGDSAEDGFLRTYEIYGMQLKARMVVLSSCNTGSGKLTSGEGILSLARGFLYSGSQSVVMSLWKMEDKSGTDIIELFYKNLKKGMNKSRALREARHSYLSTAGQLKSHPYFWSALVVYGDNSPVFHKRYLPVVWLAGTIIICLLVFYFLKRRYS
jgi:CHAT domain-containing protein/tetratricopeptide (TPR) repeat protein